MGFLEYHRDGPGGATNTLRGLTRSLDRSKEGLAVNATRKCSTDGCSNDTHSRGLCSKCYGRAYRSGELKTWAYKEAFHRLSDVDEDSRTAVCQVCGPVAIRLRKTRSPECMTRRMEDHRKYRRSKGKVDPEKDAAWRRKWKYGLDDRDYKAMVASQNGRCAICQVEARLVVDHSHDTGRVRGLLCHHCNVGLGFFLDNLESLRSAAEYLEARSGVTPA